MEVYLRRLLLDSVLSFGGRGSSSYKSRAAICRVVRRGRGGGLGGGSLSYTPRARVCQVFRWVARLFQALYCNLSHRPGGGYYLLNARC